MATPDPEIGEEKKKTDKMKKRARLSHHSGRVGLTMSNRKGKLYTAPKYMLMPVPVRACDSVYGIRFW